MWLWLLLLLPAPSVARSPSDPPEIVAVSAMCSSDGITASVDFDGAFNGKIYSLDYATVHDCLYYNALDMNTVLFSIPAHRCGTRLSRTTRNVVDQMINRVYVQMDKDFQSSHDKQFSFVCQLSEGRKAALDNTISETRRAPQRDIYATPPPLLAPVATVATPVKALSTDARQFGNWPIPGAKTYNPSMKPSPVIPRLPESHQPVLPTSESINVRDYMKPAPPMPQYGQSPVIPERKTGEYSVVPSVQRSPPISPRLPAVAVQPSYRPVNSLSSSDSYARPPIAPQPQFQPQFPSSFSSSLQRSPIIPSRVNKQQGIGMGLQPVKSSEEYTKVPAQTWNLLTTGGTKRPSDSEEKTTTEGYVQKPSESQQRQTDNDRFKIISTTSEYSTTVTVGRVFKEEPPRIGVAFTSDDNSLTDSIQPQREPESPTEFLVGKQDLPKASPTDVFLEIQRGEGPFSPPVAGPVKIGENISLVVRSRTQFEGDQFDMFVHSCFAVDGPGLTKVNLTDEKGCVLRREFVDNVKRLRNGEQQYYFFRIAAFKFPGPDDVYFSCSIDITPNRTAPEICDNSSRRIRREVKASEQLRLFDIVKVELEEQWEQQRKAIESISCVSPSVVAVLSSSVVVLLMSLLAVSYLAMSQHFRIRKISPGF